MVHRRSFIDRQTGKRRKTPRWYADVRDLAGRRHEIPTFTVKRAAERFEDNARRLLELRRAGERVRGDLAAWLDSLDDGLRNRLVVAGLVDRPEAGAGRSLTAHLDAFELHLRARGNTESHVRGHVSRVRRVIEGAALLTLADLARVEDVRRVLASLTGKKKPENGLPQPASASTINGYRRALRQFSRWLLREGHLTLDPFEVLESKRGPKAVVRRALTEDEIRRLLTVTGSQPERFGMSGPARVILYRVALETGLRRNELIQLCRGDLDFEAGTLTVRSRYAKNRREVTLPLRPDTARLLREYAGRKHADWRVFPLGRNMSTAKVLRADLEAAEIPYETADGRADFHSLRHSMITRLARSGVHPKVAQELARHSTAALTMDVYSHVERSETTRAVESLPSLDEAAG